MIKLFIIFLTVMPFAHADNFTPFIKCRKGFFSDSDYFLMKQIKDRQETQWYIVNTATLTKDNDTTTLVSLQDDTKTVLSAKKDDISSCSEKAVSTYFPSNLKFHTVAMDNPNDVFRCFCKNKPEMFDGCGFLHSVDEIPVASGYYLNILYCRKGETTEERILDQTPAYEIAKFFKGIKW